MEAAHEPTQRQRLGVQLDMDELSTAAKQTHSEEWSPTPRIAVVTALETAQQCGRSGLHKVWALVGARLLLHGYLTCATCKRGRRDMPASPVFMAGRISRDCCQRIVYAA